MTRARAKSGFTLLEVMVAVAILALSLAAIFSSEAGAVKMAHRSRKMGMATLLARCKMGEIEEEIAKLGLPAVFDSGSDACCEDSPVEGFTCDFEVEPVLLPETMFMTEEEGDPAAAKDTAAQGASATAAQGTNTLAPGADPAALAAAAALGAAPGAAPGSPAAPAGALDTDPQTMLAGGALGGVAAMAMSIVYPVLKPAFEAQIRRATVTVHWKEGSTDHSFDVTQYVVADPPAPLTEDEAKQVGQGLQQQSGMLPATGSTPQVTQ